MQGRLLKALLAYFFSIRELIDKLKAIGRLSALKKRVDSYTTATKEAYTLGYKTLKCAATFYSSKVFREDSVLKKLCV